MRKNCHSVLKIIFVYQMLKIEEVRLDARVGAPRNHQLNGSPRKPQSLDRQPLALVMIQAREVEHIFAILTASESPWFQKRRVQHLGGNGVKLSQPVSHH